MSEGVVPGPIKKKGRPFGARTKALRTLNDNLATVPPNVKAKVTKGTYGRNHQLLLQNLSGLTVAELAKEYDLKPGKVHELLTSAQRNIYIAIGKDNILTRLTAKALATLEANLNAGDKDVALRLLTDVGILQPEAKGAGGMNFSLNDGEESFDAWRIKITKKAVKDTVGGTPGMLAIEDVSPIIEAKFIEEKADEPEGTKSEAPRQGNAVVDDRGTAGDQREGEQGPGDGDLLSDGTWVA